MKLKYCGFQKKIELETAINLKVNYAGFILYPPSPRYISFEQLEKLLEKSKSSLEKSTIKTVVVSVDCAEEKLVYWANKIKIDILQLHGNEDIERILRLRECLKQNSKENTKIWKALRLKKDMKKKQLWAIMENYAKKTDAFIIEPHHKEYGGAGKSLEKKMIFNAFDCAEQLQTKIFLSGGVSAERMSEIKENFSIYNSFFGIDVSSALEEKKGIKSIKKMYSFHKIFSKNFNTKK